MAELIICDHCKQVIDDINFKGEIIAYQNHCYIQKSQVRFDLCEKCIIELYKFFDNRERNK